MFLAGHLLNGLCQDHWRAVSITDTVMQSKDDAGTRYDQIPIIQVGFQGHSGRLAPAQSVEVGGGRPCMPQDAFPRSGLGRGLALAGLAGPGSGRPFAGR